MRLSSLKEKGLPEQALEVLERRGIRELNPVQSLAVEKGLLDGKRLLLTSPTGSGKTLVAELGIISHLLKNRTKAVYVTPLRALTQEKYRTFKDWEILGLSVALTSGDYDTEDSWLRKYDIIVTTYEKLDSLWRHRPAWLNQVTYFVLDELHYISDGSRGPVVEAVATRAKERHLLGLSATVSNSAEIGSWLGAEVIDTNWRPVPLSQGVIYSTGKNVKIVMEDGERTIKGSDPILAYVSDVLSRGGQVIIFRNSRRLAEQTAEKVAASMKQLPEYQEIKNQLEQVEDSTRKEIELLSPIIERGVAYHHAGLSRGVREVIETAFLNRKIKVISATPTLAAGVNLPAMAVVIGDLHRFNRRVVGYQEEISVMEYKQMSGRAGRPGFDIRGESVIVIRNRKNLDNVVEKYIRSPPEPLESKLGSESSFYSFILGAISSEGGTDVQSLEKFVQGTLLGKRGVEMLSSALHWLSTNDFITGYPRLKPTSLGRKTAELYINPYTAKVIADGLQSAKHQCTLSYLHLVAYTPDAPIVNVYRNEEYDLVTGLECDLYVSEPFDEDEIGFYLSALKVALIVSEWIDEVPEDSIIERYNIGSGDLRNIVDSMDWLTYSAFHLSKALKLEDHASELQKLNLRVKEGVREELLDLVRVKNVGRRRARELYRNGIRSVADIARNAEMVKSLLGKRLGESIVREASEMVT